MHEVMTQLLSHEGDRVTHPWSIVMFIRHEDPPCWSLFFAQCYGRTSLGGQLLLIVLKLSPLGNEPDPRFILPARLAVGL